jgi:hypothetical protein
MVNLNRLTNLMEIMHRHLPGKANLKGTKTKETAIRKEKERTI